MKKTILTISFLFTTTIYASAITITTGEESGNYFKMGHNLAKLIGTKSVTTSKGSVMNFDRLMSGEASIAIAQKDAFLYYLGKHKDAKGKIEVIGDLGKECVYIVAKKGGKLDDDSDLQQKGVKIATGRLGSGSKITYEYMSKLEKGFAKATVVQDGGMKAISKVLSGDVDASMYMLTPSTTNKIIKTVMNNDQLFFLPVKDWDLNDKFEGKPIYTFEKMITKKGFFNDKVKTICTSATIFAINSLDDTTMDRLADAVINNKNRIIGK